VIVTNDKFIFIDNPKCASTTMRRYYSKISNKIIFQSTRNISQCNGDFSNPNYVHTNAGGILRYLESVKEDLDDFTCFTTIRDPYERFSSHYRYFLKMNENKLSKEELDPIRFLERRMTKACFPINFRFCGDFEVKNLIKVENLYEDLGRFNKMYNIGMSTDSKIKLNASNRKISDFRFTDKIVDYINDNYRQDFIVGKYKMKTSKDLNGELESLKGEK
jgi:hypothetical protein